MILAISRFNGVDSSQEAARVLSLSRAGLDIAPGFLGMEILLLPSDPRAIYALTRWTDEKSLQRWRTCKAGRRSPWGAAKRCEGNPVFEELVLTRFVGATEAPHDIEQIAADSTALLAHYLIESRTTHLVASALDGTIRACNWRFADSLKAPADTLPGSPIWAYMRDEDRATLRHLLLGSGRDLSAKFLLDFMNADGVPFTLQVQMHRQPEHFVLIGEPCLLSDEALDQRMAALNGELETVTRENLRKTRELEKVRAELDKTLSELDDLQWHMRKISELLPLCLCCHKIRMRDEHWHEIAEYMARNSLFLTHSYCPECFERVMTELGAESWQNGGGSASDVDCSARML
jgi:heme-degrading monooxygenase HmoA/uncharacterized protein YlaN (UPF0358 family)